MKQVYIATIALFAFISSFAAPKITTASSYSIWSLSPSWDLGRLPSNGDTIIVPSNSVLVVSNDIALSNVHVRVYGAMSIINNNTQINLDNNSDITVYAGGSIKGTLASQKVRIAGTVIYSGNMATITGPVSATATSLGFSTFTPLPVKFLSFSVTGKGSDMLVQWATSEEVNAFQYQVERSVDGSNWTVISHVASAGNSNVVNNYSYTDRSVASNAVYYRIKEIDLDGRFCYTSIKTGKSQTATTDINVYSTRNKLVLQFPELIKTVVSVRIISLSGQVVEEQKLEWAFGQVILNIARKGNYVVSVSNGHEVNTARQVIL